MNSPDTDFKLSLWLPDAEATEALGRQLGRWFCAPQTQDPAAGSPPGFEKKLAQNISPHKTLVFLTGELGAGKTTLTRGILRGLGHLGPVKSPTYTLLEPYAAQPLAPDMPVYHFDFYRIGDPAELDYIGIDEILDGPGLVLIEWPQRAGDRLPTPDWVVN